MLVVIVSKVSCQHVRLKLEKELPPEEGFGCIKISKVKDGHCVRKFFRPMQSGVLVKDKAANMEALFRESPLIHAKFKSFTVPRPKCARCQEGPRLLLESCSVRTFYLKFGSGE